MEEKKTIREMIDLVDPKSYDNFRSVRFPEASEAKRTLLKYLSEQGRDQEYEIVSRITL